MEREIVDRAGRAGRVTQAATAATAGYAERHTRLPAAGAHASERRHSFRVPLPGRASIWRRHKLHGHYALRDLSITGCSLRDGPSCLLGEHVELVLHLPDQPALWLSAEVRRSSTRAPQGARLSARAPEGPLLSARATEGALLSARATEGALRPTDGSLALTFKHTDARIEDRLQDLVVEVYTRMHADSDSFSLVIESRPTVRRGLVHHLSIVGEHAIGVATPLDAVQLLLERGDYVHTAFIGRDRPDAPSLELVEFLSRHYPRVRRVLMGDAQVVADSWLAEATGEVHALLETPCSEITLRKLVHRISALPPDLTTDHHS